MISEAPGHRALGQESKARAGRPSHLVMADPGYSLCHRSTYTKVFPDRSSSRVAGLRGFTGGSAPCSRARTLREVKQSLRAPRERSFLGGKTRPGRAAPPPGKTLHLWPGLGRSTWLPCGRGQVPSVGLAWKARIRACHPQGRAQLSISTVQTCNG